MKQVVQLQSPQNTLLNAILRAWKIMGKLQDFSESVDSLSSGTNQLKRKLSMTINFLHEYFKSLSFSQRRSNVY